MSSGRVRKASSYDAHDVARKKKKSEKINGTVILMKNIELDIFDILNVMTNEVGKGITLQLVSAENDNSGAFYIQLCLNNSLKKVKILIQVNHFTSLSFFSSSALIFGCVTLFCSGYTFYIQNQVFM